MNFAFSEEQEQLRDFVRQFLENYSSETTVRELMETDQGYDPDTWSMMAEQLGLQSLIIPEEHGGQGFGYVELIVVLEEMGRVLLCAPFFSTVVLAANTLPVGDPDAERLVEAWMPYRDIFDVVWSGRRHIVMGASQIDARGNQNLAAIGDWQKPKAQLLGLRGAPGNLVNHATTYWVPNHSTRTFVPEVDVVSGPGYDRVAGLSAAVRDNHEIRRVVSNLGVFDFANDEKRMQLVSVHPNITVDQVVEATGFELVVGDEVVETRLPTDEELHLIREVIDPHGLRKAEFGS